MATQRALISTRPIVYRTFRRSASNDLHTNPKALWKEINRLGSEGKWDAINNKPEMFLFGGAKQDAYGVYKAFNKSTSWFDSSAYGPIFSLVSRFIAPFMLVWVGVMIYDTIVPEQKRLHYKYQQHHGHEEEHGHADSHTHH
ncbi:unnamed protein product, partial [Mesorhabditis belari]|uniref:Uncharacterized protein n=1 Tax=Mesorhabditis belari TaxID=2138241 RepID=A0AAF3FDJ3_9BILA